MKNNKKILYAILTLITIIPFTIFLIMDNLGYDMENMDTLIIIPIFSLALMLTYMAFEYLKKKDNTETDTFGSRLDREEKNTWKCFIIALVIFIVSTIITLIQIVEPNTFPDVIYAFAICGLISIIAVFGAPASIGNIKRIKKDELYPILQNQEVNKGNICIYFADDCIVDFAGRIRKIKYDDIAIAGIGKTYRLVSGKGLARVYQEYICIAIVNKNSQETKIAEMRTHMVDGLIGTKFAEIMPEDNIEKHLKIIEKIKEKVPNVLIGYNDENLKKLNI